MRLLSQGKWFSSSALLIPVWSSTCSSGDTSIRTWRCWSVSKGASKDDQRAGSPLLWRKAFHIMTNSLNQLVCFPIPFHFLSLPWRIQVILFPCCSFLYCCFQRGKQSCHNHCLFPRIPEGNVWYLQDSHHIVLTSGFLIRQMQCVFRPWGNLGLFFPYGKFFTYKHKIAFYQLYSFFLPLLFTRWSRIFKTLNISKREL